MQRVKWVCSGCQTAYEVPSVVGLTLCPKCTMSSRPPLPVKRKRISPAWITSIIILLLAPISAGLFYWLMKSGRGDDLRKAILQPDQSKSSVRKWLKENLDDGEWEEVKWWPQVKSQSLYDANALRLIANIEESKAVFEGGGNNTMEACRTHWDAFEKVGLRSFCGLKYRTRNPLGGKVLREQIFEIVDGAAVPLKNNKVVEFPAYQGEISDPPPSGQRATVPTHDGWLFLNNPEYDPRPMIPPSNIPKQLAAAMVWKAPIPKRQPIQNVRSDTPKPIQPGNRPARKPVQDAPEETIITSIEAIDIIPVITEAQEVPGAVPRNMMEYFQKSDESRKEQVESLEKRIKLIELTYKGAHPANLKNLTLQLNQATKGLT